MADTAAPTRTRRVTVAKPATTKTGPSAKAAPAKPVTDTPAPAEDDGIQRLRIELVPCGESKTYAKFGVPEDYKGVAAGTVYVPHGTERVVLGIEGPSSSK